MLPPEVLADTRATDHLPLPAGGSPALSWLLDTPSGRRVVKIHHRGSGVVDGHDTATFLMKARQIHHVHEHRPGLRDSYVRVLRLWRTPDWAAFLMPYAPGQPLARLRTEPAEFLARAGTVLDTLARHGYGTPVDRAGTDHFGHRHAGRVRGRVPLLREHLPPDVFGRTVVINGRACRPVLDVLDQLRPPPPDLYFPVHGDLNLGNVLVTGDGFTVLDPRGTLSPWDPVYDLAKSLFSLTVFEDAMTTGFALRSAGPEFELAVPGHSPATGDLVLGYLRLLHESVLGERLSETDPRWLSRLVVAHAVHCVAEAACRLSDPTFRVLPSGSGDQARHNLATGLYLAGRWLLNDVASEPDAAGHLVRFCRLLGGRH